MYIIMHCTVLAISVMRQKAIWLLMHGEGDVALAAVCHMHPLPTSQDDQLECCMLLI